MTNQTRDTLICLFMNLTSVASVILAACLAYKDVDGWGWFLLISVLVHTGRYRSDDK